MSNEEIIKIAVNLVKKTITLHKQKKLGKEKLHTYLEFNLKHYQQDDMYSIISYFCKYLSREGYEIRKDTNHFDIINYNSIEYRKYIAEEISKLPKNYEELKNASKKYGDELVMKYDRDKDKKSFREYINLIIPTNYTPTEKTIIEIGIVSRITEKYYDIRNTEPLHLTKF